MILIDTNILVYAHVTGFPRHEAAREWLDESLNTVPQVALPWPSLLGFLRSTDGDFARFPGLSWKNPLARQGDS